LIKSTEVLPKFMCDNGFPAACLGPEAIEQLRDLVGLSDQVMVDVANRRVLEKVAKPKLMDRYDEVDAASTETISWILGPAGHSFTQWLERGSGFFNVKGKLGAGKSSLLKFLCEWPEAKKHLQGWAVGKTFVLADFFFWRWGSETQRSLDGLIRDLLYCVPVELRR
jgi:hypothetical protein